MQAGGGKRLLGGLVSVFIAFTFIFSLSDFTSSSLVPDWLPKYVYMQRESEPEFKIILLWNTFFEDPSYGFRSLVGDQWQSNDTFYKLGCAQSRCLVTRNRNLMEQSQFDAILFHERNIKTKDLPSKDQRRPDQIYIHYNLESPIWSSLGISGFESFFNISLSYREDADVRNTYGLVERVKAPAESLTEIIDKFGANNKELGATKSPKAGGAPVAQFVSNCNSKSDREGLVQSLAKHIKVDVYGGCGRLKCGRDRTEECYQMVNRSYKFYLSLENSVCQDYVTEKFFNLLPYNVIPVVLNGANMSRVAPPHSYINVRDFTTTEELATYLHTVDQDDKLFASYFWWRDYYTVKIKKQARIQAWCDLCQNLQHGGVRTPRSLNLTKVLDIKDNCQSPPFLKY